MTDYPKGAKQRFIQLVFAFGHISKEPIYSKDEVIQIMKKEFNMSPEQVSAMAKQLHHSNQMVIDVLSDEQQKNGGVKHE